MNQDGIKSFLSTTEAGEILVGQFVNNMVVTFLA